MVFIYDQGSANHPSSTIKESKSKGSFINELSVETKSFLVENKLIEIDEVWIEYENDMVFIVSIIPSILEFPFYKNKKRINLNMSFTEKAPNILGLDFTFLLDNEKHYFSNNQYFISCLIYSSEWKNIIVEIAKSKFYKIQSLNSSDIDNKIILLNIKND